MADDRTEAQILQKKYYGKPEELALQLSKICVGKPGIVYQVFLILDGYSTLDVGLRFLNLASEAVLSRLAITADGYLLCRALFGWLVAIKVDNPPPIYNDVVWREKLKIKLYIPTVTQIERRNDGEQPRQLSETEMNYYAEYNKSAGVMWENVNKVYTANGGRRNDFDSTICWQLPMSGTGYVVYNQNDLHRDYPMSRRADFKDDYGYDQIATKETIEAAITVAREHHPQNAGKPLQYGDFSRPGGINTPDHKTHNVGMAWDMRPLRKSTAVTPLELNRTTFDHPDYDREATKNFIKMVRRLFPEATFFFNDRKIWQSKDFTGIVEERGGHWDHLHVMPFLKGRE